MPGSFMDIRERLMEAMRSLDVVERDVLSCQTVLHARVGAELEPSNGGVNKLWEGSVVDANLQIVSARRKELGRLWSLDIVELNGSPLVEIERFLEPLPLRDMTVRASDKQTSDEAPLGRGQTPLVSPPQKIVFADVEQKRPAVKRKKIRPREGLQYTPGHISRIFNPEDAIDRVSRSKVVVEVEDDVEDSVGEEEPEEPILRPLSVASTGSNIAVYRPPTPKPDEIAQAVPTVAPRQKKTPPSRPDAPNVRNSSRRKRQTSSDIAIESRGTMDLDQRDGGEDNDRITYVGFVPDAVEVQEPVSQKRFRSPPGSPLLGKRILRSPDVSNTDARKAIPITSADKQPHTATDTSELSFATSNGTGLFISDKRRPKKPSVAVVEGMVLGSSSSQIEFPTSLPPAVKKTAPAMPSHSKEAPIKPSKKTTKKRKRAPSTDPSTKLPKTGKEHKRSKGSIDVGDLVAAPTGKKRPSRATMKNGAGLLIGMSGFDHVVKSKPLSWQAKGRGKGVKRAVPISEMARRTSLEDQNIENDRGRMDRGE